jgi:hypothetical protein
MSGGQGGGCQFDNALSFLLNCERPTTCRYHIPYVVAYAATVVQAHSRTWPMRRHHPFAHTIKQCSLIGELPVGRAEMSPLQGRVGADGGKIAAGGLV